MTRTILAMVLAVTATSAATLETECGEFQAEYLAERTFQGAVDRALESNDPDMNSVSTLWEAWKSAHDTLLDLERVAYGAIRARGGPFAEMALSLHIARTRVDLAAEAFTPQQLRNSRARRDLWIGPVKSARWQTEHALHKTILLACDEAGHGAGQ